MHLIQYRTKNSKVILTPDLKQVVANKVLSRELEAGKARLVTVYAKIEQPIWS